MCVVNVLRAVRVVLYRAERRVERLVFGRGRRENVRLPVRGVAAQQLNVNFVPFWSCAPLLEGERKDDEYSGLDIPSKMAAVTTPGTAGPSNVYVTLAYLVS